MYPEETVTQVDELLTTAYREPMPIQADQDLLLDNLYARRLAAMKRAENPRLTPEQRVAEGHARIDRGEITANDRFLLCWKHGHAGDAPLR